MCLVCDVTRTRDVSVSCLNWLYFSELPFEMIHDEIITAGVWYPGPSLSLSADMLQIKLGSDPKYPPWKWCSSSFIRLDEWWCSLSRLLSWLAALLHLWSDVWSHGVGQCAIFFQKWPNEVKSRKVYYYIRATVGQWPYCAVVAAASNMWLVCWNK